MSLLLTFGGKLWLLNCGASLANEENNRYEPLTPESSSTKSCDTVALF